MSPTNSDANATNKKSFFMFSILLVVVLTPVLVYLATFGVSLSRNHSVWSEFGSAMSGIYAPIIALATLCVLLVQLTLQKQLYAHETDQAYIHQARTDIEFYCTQLVKAMDKMIGTEETMRATLHYCFQPDTIDQLDDKEHQGLAVEIYRVAPEAVDLWAAIYPILQGLTAGKTTTYQMTFEGSKQKLIAILSYETCACLDNLHRTRTRGKIKVDYQFSSLVSI